MWCSLGAEQTIEALYVRIRLLLQIRLQLPIQEQHLQRQFLSPVLSSVSRLHQTCNSLNHNRQLVR